MPLVSQTLPNLLGGISQQPVVVRNNTQCEAQDNALPSPTLGLTQKPPLEQVKVLSANPVSRPFMHWINRDTAERYVVFIKNASIQVFDLAGNAKTVNTPDGVDYISQYGDMADNLSAITVADYTFIVNKQRTVAMASAEARHDTRYFSNAFWVKSSVSGLSYTARVAGVDYTVVAATNDSQSLALQLRNAINAAYGTTGITGGIWGNLVWLNYDGGQTPPPALTVKDPQGNNAIQVLKDEVKQFSDLPPQMLVGKMIKVIGTDGESAGDYYVMITKESDGTTGHGSIWEETYYADASGAVRGFNASTMPHILVRESNGTFTFKKATWDKRNVGDTTSVPNPSFVGRTISDIFFYRNRLGMCAGDNTVLSRAGDFFNFWPETARDVRDSDPIDTSVSHNKSTLIKHAVPFDRSLMLLSDQSQFNLTADGALTHETARIDVATDYETSALCKPEGAGQNLYFTSERGTYAALWEYFVTDQGNGTSANDITSHVSKLIPAGTRVIAASVNDDFIVVLTDGAKNKLYVYKMAWNGTTKILSSWGTWTLPSTAEVQGVKVIGSVVYMTVKFSATDLSLVKAQLTADTTAINECGYVPHLDRRMIQASGTYDATNDWTTWTLTYNHGNAKSYVVLTDDWGAGKKGAVLLATQPATTTLRVSGNYATGRVYLGLASTFTYTFSPLNVRVQAQDGTTSVVDGRLQIRKVYLACGPTGYLKVTVTPEGREARTYEYGSPINRVTVETPLIEEMVVKIPARGKAPTLNITVTSDSPLPLALLSATWHGEFNKKGKPL